MLVIEIAYDEGLTMTRDRLLHAVIALVLALLLLLIVRLHSAAAQPVDPHAVYEQKCARCHEPHSSGLAKEALTRKSAEVVGTRSQRELGQLLASHHGVRLTETEIKALVEHFAAMLTTGWLFQEKCAGCHETAVHLARNLLIERKGRIVGRYSGVDMEAFLAGHGRLQADEAGVILAMLRRQLATQVP